MIDREKLRDFIKSVCLHDENLTKTSELSEVERSITRYFNKMQEDIRNLENKINTLKLELTGYVARLDDIVNPPKEGILKWVKRNMSLLKNKLKRSVKG